MRLIAKHTVMVLLLAAGASLLSSIACAQDVPLTRQRPDLAIDYTVLRSNAPPASCACFYAYGGSATFAWPLKLHGVALLGDLTAGRAGDISSNHYGLTLSAYTVGARYMVPLRKIPLRPFADALVGVSHVNGSLVQGANTSVQNASASFALKMGGGVDVRLNSHLSLRLAEIDYLLTDFDNGISNRQNILRMSSGGVFHF
jgi:hypothetical protein